MGNAGHLHYPIIIADDVVVVWGPFFESTTHTVKMAVALEIGFCSRWKIPV